MAKDKDCIRYSYKINGTLSRIIHCPPQKFGQVKYARSFYLYGPNKHLSASINCIDGQSSYTTSIQALTIQEFEHYWSIAKDGK